MREREREKGYFMGVSISVTVRHFSLNFTASGPIIGFNTGFFWICATVMYQITPLLLRLLGVSGYMYFMTGINLFAFFFVLVALPETKVMT